MAVLFASLVLVACSSGGSGGGGPASGGNLGVAPNNDYSFKVASVSRQLTTGSSIRVGRVLLNENNIKVEVARILGRSAAEINQLTAGTDYTLTAEFGSGSASSAARLYYELNFVATAMAVDIEARDPTGRDFTLADIFELVPNFDFNLVVNVLAAANGRGQKITSTFRVGLAPMTGSQFDPNDPFSFEPRVLLQPRAGSVAGNLTSTIQARINENNPFNGAFTAISPNGAGTSNILSAFGLRFKNLDRTVYLGLEDVSASGGDCKSSEIYLDANGYVARASDIFNFEGADDHPSALPDCRLMISYDGVRYDPVGVPLTAATQTSLGAAQRLGTVATAQSGVAKGCPAGLTDCYYADLDIQVQDVNERPSVQLISGGNAVTAFIGSPEGVGPLPEYTTAAVVASGALASGADIDSHQLRIFDQDLIDPQNRAGGHYSIVLGGTSISVSPGHGHGKFRLVNTSLPAYSSTIAAGHIALEVNKSRLDFEDFVRGNQLDADGKAIYTIRVSVVDPQGGSATESFTYEVTDVVYNPLFVNATTPRQTISSGDFQLDLNPAIQTGAGTTRPIYVLPGIHTYQNNLANIGRVAAVNPETGTDNDLDYFLAATNARVSTSTGFSLVRGNRNIGRDLVITRADLLPSDRGSVTSFNAIGAAYKTAQTTAAYTDPQFSIQVASSQYSNLANLPGRTATADVYFTDNSIGARIDERTAGSAITFVNDGGTDQGNELDFNVNTPTTNQLDSPRYGLVPADLLGSVNGLLSQLGGSQAYVVGAGNDFFDINPQSGQISTRTGVDNLVFASPGYYVLPVYVRNLATATRTGPVSIAAHLNELDIALVTLLIEDDNAAPTLVSTTPAGQNETPSNTSSPLEVRITVPETAGSQGTQVGDRLFSFVVSDDNNLYGGVDNLGTTFEMAAGISGSPSPALLDRYLNVTFRAGGNQEQLIADVTLKAELDYEDSAVLTAFAPANQGKFIVKITDAGEYELNSGTLVAEAKSPAASQEDLQLRVNMRVTDIAEAPELKVDGSLATLTISETASRNTRVQNGNSDLVINIENPRALAAVPAAGTKYQFNASSGFNYMLTGDLANILQVEQDLAATTTTSTDPVPLVLTVRDEDALENVGDGRTFPLTIRMTTPNGLSSNTISLNVMVEDAGQPATLPAITGLTVNEDNAPNGASGYVIPWPQGIGGSLTPASVTDDWDDRVLGGSGLTPGFNIQFRLENQAVANTANLYGSSNFKPLGLRTTQNGQQELYVADGNFIEAVLFGDITADIVVYDTLRDAASAELARASITVTVVAASGGKNLVYRGAGNAADASTYTASYTQNAFVAGRQDANMVLYNYTNPRVAAGTIGTGGTILTPNGGIVSTINVVDGAGTLEGNFPARNTGIDFGTITEFSQPAAATPPTPGANNLDLPAGPALPGTGSGTTIPTAVTPLLAQINLNANTNLTDTSSVRILRAEGGELVDAAAEFNRYFTLNVVNTATASTQLQIAQRIISRDGAPGLGGNVRTSNYFALDSLPLFQGAEDQHNFTYYLRTYSGGTVASNNASFYALAQFNLIVEAASNPTPPNFPLPPVTRGTADASANKVATRLSGFSYTRPELVFTPTRAFSENLGVLGLSNAQETAEPITDSEFKLAYANLENENDLLAYNFALQLTNAAGEQVDFLVWQGQNPEPTGTGWVRNYLQLNRPLQADELGEYNVAWSVTDETGDPVAELAGSFILLAYDATLNPVLAEGEEAYFADFVSAVANGQPLEIINDIVGYSAIEVKAGTEISLDFSIIDGDPQDGVPHAPEASNILRPTGFAWQGLSKLPDYSDYSCANVIKDLAITNYVALPADPAQSIAKVSFTALADSANGGCWLSFIDGEDGAFFDRTLIISIQP